MLQHAKSIRPFIGAKDYDLSRSFYRAIGFEETILFPDMSVFKSKAIAFYLQRAYVKDWIDNSMIFVEVEDVDECYNELSGLDLSSKFAGTRLTGIRDEEWGRECFLHDPSGVLWHFGQFAGK